MLAEKSQALQTKISSWRKPFIGGKETHMHQTHRECTEKKTLCKIEGVHGSWKSIIFLRSWGFKASSFLPYCRIGNLKVDRMVDWSTTVVWHILIQPWTCWASPSAMGLMGGSCQAFVSSQEVEKEADLLRHALSLLTWFSLCLPSVSPSWSLSKDSADRVIVSLLIAIYPFAPSEAFRIRYINLYGSLCRNQKATVFFYSLMYLSCHSWLLRAIHMLKYVLVCFLSIGSVPG